MYNEININLIMTLPYDILLVSGILALIITMIARKREVENISYLGIIAVCTYLTHLWKFQNVGQSAFSNMLLCDSIGYFCTSLIGISALGVLLMSSNYINKTKIPNGEYTSLLLFATFALGLLTISNELITFFVNIEMVSLCFYILTVLNKKDDKAGEAAFKYFILGSFSAGFIVLGIAFIYGATGTTYFNKIAEVLASGKTVSPLWVTVGFMLLLIGFGFKMSLVPFHFWTPEVYEGAPTPVTAFLATGSKIAGFAVFFRFASALSNHNLGRIDFITALWVIAFLTVIVGNLMALMQHKMKRLFAFSSIAHSGYMTLAILAVLQNPEASFSAASALAFYMMAYVYMNLLAFGTMCAIGDKGDREITEYIGLYQRQPALALAMLLALFSLTGIPPTAGFFGKFYVFRAALDSGFILLPVIAILASVISAFYYLRIVVFMFMKKSEKEIYPLPMTKRVAVLIVFASVMTILYGLFPQMFLK